MLILTQADVRQVLTIQETIAAVEDGFRHLALGDVVMPQRAATPVKAHNGLHLSMPAFVGGTTGTLTVKIVTVYGDNPGLHGLPMIQGILLLYDAQTGKLLAMMDAEYLTAMRTGAASGVATNYLAREDAAVVTLFGAGAQAAAQLAAVCAVRSVERAFVVTRSGAKDREFCLKMENALAIQVTPTRDVRAAVEAADVICTATNSTMPVFNGNWLQPGVHINAVGAYMTSMRELDAVTVERARLFVDHHEAAQSEAGDIMIPVANGDLTYDTVTGELGDVIIGRVRGRLSDDDVTVFKSVGLAMQDATTAGRVYSAALAADLGKTVEL